MPEQTNPLKLQNTSPILFDRRGMLKSACATALLSASGAAGGTSSHTDPQPHGDRGGAKDLSRNLLGFMLPHEQFKVTELVELGIAAENAGFDLLATSDHLQPWQSNEGHSGLAWVTMSAIGARTKRVWERPSRVRPSVTLHQLSPRLSLRSSYFIRAGFFWASAPVKR
jgi:hypothetical protein